ncbi:hypothetical protein F383_24296 [Gossypium arboreum]|uniref:Uncharacterized protein n=1 Tax=Gossypium arboreum TaxID=29729 RepID=A0A0B0MR71_GOSAR|nr:hypothetical protein F383_24296 [Gossypium arboreum]
MVLLTHTYWNQISMPSY